MLRMYATIVGAVVAVGVAHQAAAQSGEMLAMSCIGCHGSNHTGSGSIPTLRGKPAKDIADMMKAFQEGKRPQTVMTRLSKGFSDAEIADVAQYLSQLK